MAPPLALARSVRPDGEPIKGRGGVPAPWSAGLPPRRDAALSSGSVRGIPGDPEPAAVRGGGSLDPLPPPWVRR